MLPPPVAVAHVGQVTLFVPVMTIGELPVIAVRYVAGSMAAVIEQKLGCALLAVQFPKTLFAAAVSKLKEMAGAVVGVATLVVNSGERFPALTEMTLPVPLPAKLVSSGAAAVSVAPISCVAPLMVNVTLNCTGPLPKGKGIPCSATL